MKNYIVYMHVSPSNKRYIGITCQEVNQRWQNGNGYRNNKYFTRAIKKYGWNNFKHIIVAENLIEEQAKEMEIKLIKEYDTTNTNKGYNITKGGESANGLKHTEETKEKISNSLKGKIVSEETKEKMKENHADVSGENHPNYGRHLSEETKRKIGEGNKGKFVSDETKEKISIFFRENNPNKKAIICLTTNKIFNSAKEGAEYYNIKCSGNITKCCQGKLKSAGKSKENIKLTWCYLEDYLEMNKEEMDKKIKKSQEIQNARMVICLTTNKIFNTVTEGAEYYNCDRSHICRCCEGKQGYCGKLSDGTKLVWKYLN